MDWTEWLTNRDLQAGAWRAFWAAADASARGFAHGSATAGIGGAMLAFILLVVVFKGVMVGIIDTAYGRGVARRLDERLARAAALPLVATAVIWVVIRRITGS